MSGGDACVYCGDPTSFGAVRDDGSLVGKFVNRLPVFTEDGDGYACAECAGYECDECGERIYLDHETRVDSVGVDGVYRFGNYHTACHVEGLHGRAIYGDEVTV